MINLFKDATYELHLHSVVSSFQIIGPSRFSKWKRMMRALTYGLRFIDCLRKKQKNSVVLSQEELSKAESFIYKQAQSDEYRVDISFIETELNLPIKKRTLSIKVVLFTL